MKFKISRKCIKGVVKDKKRDSRFSLEREKNLTFHPKKKRSKTVEPNNGDFRLKALNDLKEEMIIRNSFVLDEIDPEELELKIPIMPYSYNCIKREILP